MKGLYAVKIGSIATCIDSKQIVANNFAEAFNRGLDYINKVVKESLEDHPAFDKKEAEAYEKKLRKDWQIREIFLLQRIDDDA
jgi:hypothetical protein